MSRGAIVTTRTSNGPLSKRKGRKTHGVVEDRTWKSLFRTLNKLRKKRLVSQELVVQVGKIRRGTYTQEEGTAAIGTFETILKEDAQKTADEQLHASQVQKINWICEFLKSKVDRSKRSN